MKTSKIEIIGNEDSPITAHVYIDGHEIQGVSRVAYEHSAGNTPEITIDISGLEMDLHALRTNISETARVVIRRG